MKTINSLTSIIHDRDGDCTYRITINRCGRWLGLLRWEESYLVRVNDSRTRDYSFFVYLQPGKQVKRGEFKDDLSRLFERGLLLGIPVKLSISKGMEVSRGTI